MAADLLASKFFFPPRRPDFVPRPHLLDRLDAGLSGKLTLVSAPAGFGKSSVVSEWIRERGYPAAWFALDKNDNDPSRFLMYLIAALQRVEAGIGADVQAALDDAPSPQFELLLPRLIREIESLPEKTIVVLDDYHLIEAQPVHEAIHFLIEYMPPMLHLVIAGRTDPPLPVARLRVQGQVNEVRTSQLRFTREEVAAFLNDRLGFALAPEEIAALEARTEGWIASLKLAAISMRGRDDRAEFIAKFSGSHRYVIDYLVDEVMARQPEAVQAFLRRTSILERFCAPLCAYVTGESTGLEIIDTLDRSNLFLIPLDDQREWYRYHHLFADFLQQRLRVSEPDQIPELHRRASQWYQCEGLVDEAIQHALAAEDYESAARLIDGIAVDLVMRRESYKLLRFVEQLPPDLLQGSPMLCVWHAWALVFMGQVDQVETYLSIAEANPKQAPGAPKPGYVTTVRAYLAKQQGDLRQSMRLTEQALAEMAEALPDRITLIFRGAAVIWLGVNHRVLGHLEKARQYCLEAAEINQKVGNLSAALGSVEQLAEVALIRGQLDQAAEIYRSGLKLTQNWPETGGRPKGDLIADAWLHLGLGTVLYQWNDLEGATAPIQRCAGVFELGGYWGRMHAYTMLAYVKQARGEFAASAEWFRKACAIDETLTVRRSYTTDLPSLVKVGILLSRRGPEMAPLLMDARRLVEKLGVSAADEVDFTQPASYPREMMYSDLAWLLIATGRATEALPLLARLLAAAQAMERHGDALRYLVMLALAQQALGNTQAALVSLAQALALAEPQGYVRLFVDEGQPAADLLRLALARQISTDYARRLLAAFPAPGPGAAPPGQALAARGQTLVDPLSERELDVLSLMAEGCSYQEIAERLVISINTVRHHTRNVYSKLDANNRTEAVGRAKELRLL